ncbi:MULTISPECIES: type III-A CRISPR-associated RAMP protein Csm3 [Bacteroidaceae]|uniref:CRISPR system Cms endoribonuclease Csm3 n=1 Tax=Bacteroides acidifaciens TaxID=85831 RepID=A0A4S2AX91_9BACE|nr:MULTISPECIES: type III-A CRISPR-associated RAMP protein Csm3 [Bacteroidaceae]TGY06051.1 type III-A CRISPR-associated RAMP protein Csm3 [Bacteroides acidifaciens]
MATIKLEKKIVYTGIITLKTGLHIGGTNASLNIGGPDNFVVRNPIDNIPYIPGSSLKGKMRALVEILNGETNNGRPTNRVDTKAGTLFGVSADAGGHPSRLIVRDSVMITELDTEDELNLYGLTRKDVPDFSHTDLPYTESKTEAMINRITAGATPRTFERVPAGAQFKLNMVLNVFEGEDESSLKATVAQAISLLEDDYLGGNGSRGYGQVSVKIVKEEFKTY